MAKILEKGATFNKTHKSILQQIKELISGLPLDSEETDANEASTWSNSDIATNVQKALKTQSKYGYLLDIFPEEKLVVYQTGWIDGKFYQANYTMDETGVITLGDPKEVNRKVSYLEVSEPTPDVTVMPEESANAEITSDSVQLVERAVNPDGITMLKLISPGLGSSGYYSESVLKDAVGKRVFKKGLHNLIDHPTPAEESARPEGSLDKLGGTLIEDATWRDDYHGHGPGVYAKAKVTPNFQEKLNSVATDIGVSIRAKGKAHIGNVDGKQVPIIDTIEQARSVDYVTLPGRGGKVIELMESNREATNMAISEEQFNQLVESNRALTAQLAQLREGQALQQAERVVNEQLSRYVNLPKPTKERLAASLPSQFTMTESGALDVAALQETVKTAVTDALSYLSTLGLKTGDITDLGGSSNSGSFNVAEAEKRIADNLAALG
jgi:hypothetical protein